MGMHINLMVKNMAIDRPDGYPTSYTYILNWDELWAESRGGVGGSGAREGNDEE